MWKIFQNGKSPGDNGYTAVFHKQFFSLVRQDLVNSLNAAFDTPAKRSYHAFAQRRFKFVIFVKLVSTVIICMLLYVVYKIALKVIADQTGFMKGDTRKKTMTENFICEVTKQNATTWIKVYDQQQWFLYTNYW